MKPAAPAADMVWPMLPLMLPRLQKGCSRAWPARSLKKCLSAPTSTTSPTVVAVPWVST